MMRNSVRQGKWGREKDAVPVLRRGRVTIVTFSIRTKNNGRV